MLYNTSYPFHLIQDLMQIPFGRDVYVISDATYKELQQTQAENEIAVLQKRLSAYESSANQLRETIAELQTEHGLLPEAPKDK